jgi:acyl-CoA thioesterase
LNAAGIAQGGAIFTLADFCFAVHANLPYLAGEREAPTVGQSNSISFLRPGTGARLIARSACLSRGKSAAVFRVDVEDEKGRLVAAMTGNGLAAAKKPG